MPSSEEEQEKRLKNASMRSAAVIEEFRYEETLVRNCAIFG
jgi:hypothetical protein